MKIIRNSKKYILSYILFSWEKDSTKNALFSMKRMVGSVECNLPSFMKSLILKMARPNYKEYAKVPEKRKI